MSSLNNYPSKLCTFCYKNVFEIRDDGNPEKTQICDIFYKFLNDIVKNPSSLVTWPCELVFCKDCEFLIGELGDVKHQINCLELQLQWKLDMLVSVMKLADKVPSRVKTLKQSLYHGETNIEISSEGQIKSVEKNHSLADQSAYQQFRKSRQEILDKCCRGRDKFNLQPRVILKRLNQVDETTTNTKTEKFSEQAMPNHEIELNFVIGWLMSFGAVVFLQSLYADCKFDSHANDSTISFVYEDNDLKTLEEPLEEVVDHQEISTTPPYQSDNNEAHDAEERLSSVEYTNFSPNIYREPENDYSSTSSEETIPVILNLKQEPNCESDTKNLRDDSSIHNDEKNPPSFPCQFCSVICNSESLLHNHEKLEHPKFKTKLIRTNYPFSCSLCKGFYKTYSTFRKHKFGSFHRALDKQRATKYSNVLANVKSEPSTKFQRNMPYVMSKKHRKQSTTKLHTQEVSSKTILKRYNLRSIKTNSYTLKDDHLNDEESGSDDEYTQDTNSSDTSSSENTDVEENGNSTSYTNRFGTEEKLDDSVNPKLYRCLSDNCALKHTMFYKKHNFGNHKKLHIRGEYQCNFCDKVEVTITNLALHETEMHSAIPSTSSSTRNSDNIFYCARYPFESLKEGVYFKHFASVHLGIKQENKKIKCNKCSVEFKTRGELAQHKKVTHHDEPQPKVRTYKCEKCEETFERPFHLERHIAKEHPDSKISRKFKCDKCSRYFCRAQGLKIHIMHMHSGKRSNKLKDSVRSPYMCLFGRCKRSFTNKDSLELHHNLHKSGKYSCNFCDAAVDSILKLSMHEYLKHSERKGGIFHCSRCGYRSPSIHRYQKHFAHIHMKTHVKPSSKGNDKLSGKYQCNFCEVKTVTASELGYHEANHVNKTIGTDESVRPQIQCPRCQKSYTKFFYIKHYLKVHFDGSTKEKQTTCTICQEKATRPKEHFTKYHKTDDLEDPSDIYKCDEEEGSCKAYFIKYYQFIQHKRKMHQKSKDWTCTECGKTFKWEKGLQSHVRNLHLHLSKNPELPFSCDEETCKRTFGTKDELEHHKKYVRHKNGQNKLKCEKCGKGFSNKITLETHLNKAHSVLSFICQECGKVFKTKGNLKMHLEYHKGPESWKFECSTCGKKCVSKNVLDTHLRTHTGEKPYVCQYCGEKYAHIHNWKNHMLTKHKNEDDLPSVRKTPSTNRLSRKGTKKGDCVIAEVKQ